jgi:hypothetical protein
MLRSCMSSKISAVFLVISSGGIAFGGTADLILHGHELKAEVTESVAPRKVTDEAIIANARLGDANAFVTKHLERRFHDV